MADIVDSYDLRKYFKLDHLITGAYWNDQKGLWEVHVKNLVSGQSFVDTCDVFINGGGLLK